MMKIPANGLDIEIEEVRRIIRINGCPIAFELFESWGMHGLPIGAIFRIDARADDGALTVTRLDKLAM